MFKVYDNQLSRYAFEGKKFKTKEEAIEQLLSFFSVDNNKKELKKKFNINPSSDDDKDGFINKNDCRPWDKNRQDEKEKFSALSYEKWLRDKRQARGYYKQDIERKKEQIDNQIKSLKKEIETTKEEGEKEISRLKRILEDNKKEDRTQYELYVEQSRKSAEASGYEWVEPE